MKGYKRLEDLLNKLVVKARILKKEGMDNKSIENALKKYNADNLTITLVMVAI